MNIFPVNLDTAGQPMLIFGAGWIRLLSQVLPTIVVKIALSESVDVPIAIDGIGATAMKKWRVSVTLSGQSMWKEEWVRSKK